jgi:hypothetical protein
VGYKARSWRDSQGEPRDPFGDTHPNILKLAKDLKHARDTGELPNLAVVLERITDSLANLSARTQIEQTKLAGRLERLQDRVTLLLWAAGIIFVAMVTALFKALHL